MSESYYAYDGEEYEEFSTIDGALDYCNDAIQYCRDCCDPEWPMNTSEICIHYGKSGLTEWEDICDLDIKFTAREVDIRVPSSELDEYCYDSNGDYWGDGCEYMCDYQMSPVAAV